MERENWVLPYSLGFVALTAVAVMGGANSSSLIPSQLHEFSTHVEICKPWEQNYVTTTYALPEMNREVIAQVQSIQTFADNLLKETMDLDPRVVDVVNTRFWDMLA